MPAHGGRLARSRRPAGARRGWAAALMGAILASDENTILSGSRPPDRRSSAILTRGLPFATVRHLALGGNPIPPRTITCAITSEGVDMARPRTPQPPTHLVSARMLDVTGGTLVEPGDLLDRWRPHRRGLAHLGARRCHRDRPRGRHHAPGADGHGGQPGDGWAQPCQPAHPGPGGSGPADAAGGGQRPPDPPGRLHHGAQSRAVRADRRHPARRGPHEGHRHGLGAKDRGSSRPDMPSAPPGGHLDPTMFQAFAPHVLPLTVEEGIANGVVRGAQGRPLPDQVRRPGHQGQRLGRGHVAHRPGRRPPVLHRGAGGDRRRGPPRRPEGRRPLPRGRGHPGGASSRASTASSTAR